MKLSAAQLKLLHMADTNNGLFESEMSPLKGGALNNVITALQTKSCLDPKTPSGYPITDTGKAVLAKYRETPPLPSARKGSKLEKLIHLLKRKHGATNEQLCNTLCWQPHSVRGVISGTLKKKMGFFISTNTNKAGTLIYKITN